MMTEWLPPAVGLASFLLWVWVTRRVLRWLNANGVQPVAVLMLATVTLIAACLALSSLTYPGVITTEVSRAMVNLARLVLLVGGVAVLFAGARGMAR